MENYKELDVSDLEEIDGGIGIVLGCVVVGGVILVGGGLGYVAGRFL
ncbi:class IIb bacteriocin, lactobin A/cerein 7B family [Listeria cossartiae]|nr:class IIb bacteriocin, lactobin A/cerein 7B family [Listeria cossartiae]MCD2246591.1 class IIb bacteriocin, lactobin A/cerein 7B family [Listeria marthii]MBC1543118.1 class IIb bacteriocin, lactobin A/cerein 7B family [Listeria cossartiae subsp. cossartiae]MBC1550150.1 class IIb bacteriocin, lactobin A/cerein 7B family [Listeria cossartiae subsp. cossartiae]MBC1567880.1 class IIb bacteriocin, lactobin A/cerein 7B family [Listeria cossartiae subsp. cossartiae]MBC1571035.1 class IIb bacterioc